MGLSKPNSLEPGIAPTLVNSWVNQNLPAYGPCAYYKTPQGLVFTYGALSGGVSGTAAFTLPAGYRRTKSTLFICLNNDAVTGYVEISGVGVFNVFRGVAAGLFINNVIFRADS